MKKRIWRWLHALLGTPPRFYELRRQCDERLAQTQRHWQEQFARHEQRCEERCAQHRQQHAELSAAFWELHRQVREVLPGELIARVDHVLVPFHQAIQADAERLRAEVRGLALERGGGLTEEEYVRFEEAFRGSRKLLRARMQSYVPLLAGRRRVLDVGCGDGTFLRVLREHDIPCRGIDVNDAMVARARRAGLWAETADAFDFLGPGAEERFDAITALHVVEHFSPVRLREFLRRCHAALEPGGLLVLEFPNAESLSTLSRYQFLDPTHEPPRSPHFVLFLAELEDFREARLELVNEAGADEQLAESWGEPASPGLRENFRKLNHWFFVGTDARIVAVK